MKQCDNCEARVTDEFARVFLPDSTASLPVCPACTSRADIAGTIADRLR
jgi:NAD-dependent SIR2 family protein deacetylase